MIRPAAALLAMALLVLAGCATTTVVREEPAPARSVAAAEPRAAATGPTYRVQRGDTLYGIAFRKRLDWRELARWNGIVEPYTIVPEQVLRLSAPGRDRTSRTAPPVASVRPAAPQGVVSRVVSPPPPIPRGPVASPPPVGPPPTVSPPPAPPPGSGAFRPGQWQWPTEGQVVARFAEGDKARQGIAIAGTAGQPVRAAAAGTVVYSGAGLVGYGELIIIKHDDEWLSAYGHNRRRLVAEGATVSAGQQVAELGRTGTSRDLLHFEIRRNGRPVDPSPLLPRR